MRKIYTIGYGGRKFEDFVRILKNFGIETVIDVRAFPTSKYPGFKREELEKNLPHFGISYIRIEELGGYRKGGYEAYTQTEEFGQGLEKLEELARQKLSVLMCLEGYPSGCHRRFIARELRKRGWQVLHIVGKGRLL